MKFDESNVINALHTDKAVIGSKGYFSDDIIDLKTMAEEEEDAYLKELNAINTDRCTYPFFSGNGHWYGLFYPVVIPKKKKLVPFTWEDREMLRGKWIRKKEYTHEMRITNIFFDGDDKELRINGISAANIFDKWEFLDGSPCGKEIDE